MREAKIRAVEQGITLTQLINEALRERLSAQSHQRIKPFRLRSYGKDGLRPGVSLDDKTAVGDLMDEDTWLLEDGSSS